MSGAKVTANLRIFSSWFWAIGLAVIALDFLAVPVLEHKANISYFFFAVATALVAWAEKREFSSRIFLYRLHDAVIFSPWRYLLLYFLWISLFSPFTEAPKASLTYALNGWLSLFTVGISAQFIFCERGINGVSLLPDRMRLIFRIYTATVGLLLTTYLASLFSSQIAQAGVIGRPANLFLYFSLGLPFLLWDFVKDGRRFLPRAESIATICLGSILILLVSRRYFQASLLFSLAGVIGLFLYKTMRPQRITLRLALVAVAAGFGALGVAILLQAEGYTPMLIHFREKLESNLREGIQLTWDALRSSNFLGRGLGVTNIHGVWARVLAEAGVVGFAFYALFFLSVAWDLYRVKRSPRVVVSNVALVSTGVFLLFASHYIENPYGAYVWIWYSIWALVASTPKRKKLAY